MIIDIILDRAAGEIYNTREFYHAVTQYESHMDKRYPISRALDMGTEEYAKKALCDYIDSQDYNPRIKDFINHVVWADTEADYEMLPDYAMMWGDYFIEDDEEKANEILEKILN